MKTNRIIFWIATAIIVIMEGIMPLATVLFASEYVTVGTDALGYPQYFAYALISCKILGSIAIAVPKFPPVLKEWAYAGFTFNLLFATLSHLVVDRNPGYIAMPLVVLAVLMVSYVYQKKLRAQA